MNGRSISAVFGGIIAGVLIALLLAPVVDKLYPVDHEAIKALGNNREAIAEYLRNLPAGFHFLGIAIAVVRLTVGLVIGGLIDKSNPLIWLVIGAFFLLLAILDVFAYPHPAWFGFVYIPVIIGVTFGFIYTRKKA